MVLVVLYPTGTGGKLCQLCLQNISYEPTFQVRALDRDQALKINRLRVRQMKQKYKFQSILLTSIKFISSRISVDMLKQTKIFFTFILELALVDGWR